MISEEAYMQTKSMGEEVSKVKCQFRWKIRIKTKHREGKETTIKQATKNGPVGTGINAQDEGHELRNEGEISW